MRVNGREIADKLLDELKIRVQELKEKGITPTLAIIMVGNNPQSVSYIEQKELKANKIGAKVIVENLDENISENELLNLIHRLNKDPRVHGIIVQRPVLNISSEKLNSAVVPKKDVDGFNHHSEFDFPIVKAVLGILEHIYISTKKDDQFYDFLRRSKIVLIGKGETGGGPIIKTFEKKGINFNVIDSSTHNSSFIIHNSEIVISAVGKPNIINSKMIRDGAILISVGIHKEADGKLHGDYDEEKIKNIASFYTPTPGGVGPVNVAMLLKNLVKAAENQV